MKLKAKRLYPGPVLIILAKAVPLSGIEEEGRSCLKQVLKLLHSAFKEICSS